MTYYDILGVKTSNLGLEGSLEKVKSFLSDKKKHYIVTPNPEFIISAQKNTYFKSVLNSSDLSIPDGFGLLFASKYLSEISKLKKDLLFPLKALVVGIKVGIIGFFNKKYLDVIKEEIPGVDFMYKLLERFSKSGTSVYLIGTKYQNGMESANMAKESLQKLFPSVYFVGACSGRYEDYDHRFKFVPIEDIYNNICEDLGGSNLDLIDFVFVAFGHVRQESWIYENLEKLPFKVAVGVGGAFDFVSGRKKRAPTLVRNLKLEWLFRLLVEPSFERFRRVFTAFPYFPLVVYFKSLSTRDF